MLGREIRQWRDELAILKRQRQELETELATVKTNFQNTIGTIERLIQLNDRNAMTTTRFAFAVMNHVYGSNDQTP